MKFFNFFKKKTKEKSSEESKPIQAVLPKTNDSVDIVKQALSINEDGIISTIEKPSHLNPNSRTWSFIQNYVKNREKDFEDELKKDLSMYETGKVRGRLDELSTLLELPETLKQQAILDKEYPPDNSPDEEQNIDDYLDEALSEDDEIFHFDDPQ